MRKNIFLLLLLCAVTVNAQFYVSSGSTVDVAAGVTLYSNEDITNDGTINLRDASVLEFDANLTNNALIDYEPLGASTPGILKVGSGESTAGAAQSLQFNDGTTEDIPLIELEKAAGTIATINRGHVRLTQRFRSVSGIFDGNSSIVDVPAVNTSFGLTFISPDATTTAVVEESVGGEVRNVIIERYVPGSSEGGNRAFRAFTSSVTLNTNIKDNLQEGGQIDNVGTDPTLPAVDDPRPGFGTHITGATVANPNFDNYFANLVDAINTGLDITNTGNPGMYLWDNANQNYTPILNSVDPLLGGSMDSGVGYMLFIRGDRSLDLTVNNTQVGAAATTLRMLGDLQIGSTTFTATTPASGDIVLVGNPYQAQVDLIETLQVNATTGVNTNNFSVYDPKLGIHGAFVTVDITDPLNVFNTVPPTPGGTSDANEFLQPNQAVFLTTTATSVNVVFEENDKKSVDQNTGIDIFSDDDASATGNDVDLYVTLFNVDQNTYNDNVLVKYGNYTDDFGNEDGPKYWNQYENVAVENGNVYTHLEKRNINGAMDNILLNVSNYSETNYQIITNVTNIQQLDNAYLIDHYLDTETELDEGNNVYNFTVDNAVPASKDANRFEIGINMETLGVDNPNAITELTLYPNPASETVELSLSGLADAIESIDVISVDGKLVKTLQVDSLTRYTMDVSTMATGVYVVKATTANATYTEKLIVK